ncbi:hypothetical protein CLV49_2109 [Labedella gwakjiensis]|uniref:Uncharacterized protein n=1 Tax=Labedella gwakjiensis TaxID=390269 RepID=A0A2P8GWZ8_9MICO|nr:hypothetical protein CLV49_2109 [Labedella gwakjiensis]
MMLCVWRRKQDAADGQAAATPGASGLLGVGVQVYVLEGSPGTHDHWEGEPTGVIVSLGDSRPDGVVGIPRLKGQVWKVVFDEPQYRPDGTGPRESAEIPASLLVAAPFVSGDDLPAELR